MGQLNFWVPGSDDDAKAIRQQLNIIAAGLGYTAKAGPGGSGGAAAMLVAVTTGQLEVRKVARIVTVEMTAERLRAMDDNGYRLWSTPGDAQPYWDSQAHYIYDKVVGSAQDFMDEAGYSDLDGVDDEVLSLDIELVPERT